MHEPIAERIQLRLDTLGKSARRASMEAGLGPDAIHNILRGKSANPRRSTLGKLAGPLQCSVAFLIGDAEAPGNTVDRSIDQGGPPVYLAVRRLIEPDEEIRDPVERATGDDLSYFPARLIQNQLRTRADSLRVMTVEGPSMEPVLKSGDEVLVDTSKRNPSQPGIFVLWDGHGMVVKWLERIPRTNPPSLRVISENDLFPAVELTESDVEIVGRVAWYSRRL